MRFESGGPILKWQLVEVAYGVRKLNKKSNYISRELADDAAYRVVTWKITHQVRPKDLKQTNPSMLGMNDDIKAKLITIQSSCQTHNKA